MKKVCESFNSESACAMTPSTWLSDCASPSFASAALKRASRSMPRYFGS